jgi:hypothetical protein
MECRDVNCIYVSVADYFEHSNEPSGFLNLWEFIFTITLCFFFPHRIQLLVSYMKDV